MHVRAELDVLTEADENDIYVSLSISLSMYMHTHIYIL